jgi:hypothetical protein
MDPISIAIELELATLILAGVGGFATWLHHVHSKHAAHVRERHHQELKAQDERHHAERLRAIHGAGPQVEIDIERAK